MTRANVERSADAKVRLAVRAAFYALYAVVVWIVVAETARNYCANRLDSSDFRALTTAFFVVATSSVFGGLATFVAAARYRRKRGVGIEEAFWGIAGRTGVPAVALLVVVAFCVPAVERPVLLASLAAYFLTAPIALWLTFPPENAKISTNVTREYEKRE